MARPSAFQPDFVKQAYHLALLGATDADLATAFDVNVRTIERWKKSEAEFCRALKKGKEQADAKVAKSLYRRALGYSHDAVKILTVADGDNQGSHVESVPYIERYPPDTTAAIFWLKNRRPDLWRDKQAVEHSGEVAGTGVLAVPVPIDAAAWADIAKRQQAELAKASTGEGGT